jgi:hypothetical protein
MLALYGLLQLISNFIAWLLPVDEQAKYQFVRLVTWRVWLVATPILTLAIIALIVRSALRVIAERDARHATEIRRVKKKYEKRVEELNARLDVFKPKLIFEVERCPRCRVTLSHEKYLFDPPDGEPKEVDYYAVSAHVKIHFDNDDEIELRLQRRMTVSLFRRTGRGKEKEIPLDPERESLLIAAGEGSRVTPKLEALTFAPLKPSKTFLLFCAMGISTRYGKRLNRDCFIRLTMEAIRQLPCYVDLDVDWEAAKTEKGSAMTPRTSARCQAHK